MRKSAGLSIIELVGVLVILALLGAMAVPLFSGMQRDALTAAKNGSTNSIKSALAISIAELKALPTVTQLAANVDDARLEARPEPGGVRVSIDGQAYLAPTYTDAACTQPTRAVTDTVACVGRIP